MTANKLPLAWVLALIAEWSSVAGTEIKFFSEFRVPDEAPRDGKSCPETNHHPSPAVKSASNHTSVKTPAQEVPASSSMLSSFLYGMPVPSQTHPDAKGDPKPSVLHGLVKERLSAWAPSDEKAAAPKEATDNGERFPTCNIKHVTLIHFR